MSAYTCGCETCRALGPTGDDHTQVFRAFLQDGTPVVGKMYKGKITPATYANRTQANVRASLCGGVVIQRDRPFYVVLP